MQVTMATGLQWLILTVGLMFVARLQLSTAEPQAGEEPLDGPNGLKVFVGKRGGTIRLHRELPHPPPNDQDGDDGGGRRQNQGGRGDTDRRGPPPKSGEISMRLGRIQEVDSSSSPISGNHGVKKPDSVDFTVQKET